MLLIYRELLGSDTSKDVRKMVLACLEVPSPPAPPASCSHCRQCCEWPDTMHSTATASLISVDEAVRLMTNVWVHRSKHLRNAAVLWPPPPPPIGTVLADEGRQ